MALKKQMCANHGDRSAIGVCVITRKPICAEYSTRYEGVNYSWAGLRILQQRRAVAVKRPDKGYRIVTWLSLVLSPVLLFLVYRSYYFSFTLLIDWQQLDIRQILGE